MSKLRNAASHISRLFSANRGECSAVAAGIAPDMVEVATAIQSRQAGGHATTLRQLHTISSLSQPQALTLIRALERAGIVHIESNLGDAFESTITLTEKAQRWLDRDLTGQAR
ncbi:hypothetical protein [Qipengyuania sp. ASV99]|uniref:hypothetical protein n=1 Tax=Qipengyuania sp. ASV99 TaxID=3399681 RepID=UPI003A4C6500